MKNFMLSKNSSSVGTLAFVLLIFTVIACTCPGKSKNPDAKPIPAAYFGDWKGLDGSAISIRSDGTGDYKSGSTNVTGGAAEINDADKTLSITFFGIGKTLKINQEPKNGQMKLEDVIYRKDTASYPDEDNKSESTDSKPSGNSKNSPFPVDSSDSDEAAVYKSMVKSTLQEFTSAVDSEDFSDFRSACANDFKRTYTTDEVNKGFQSFTDNKSRIVPILQEIDELDLKFDEAPAVLKKQGNSFVNLKGTFPSSTTTYFDLEYVKEGGNWKLLKIEVRVK
jgi:hypothetical protein